jgi:folate-binding protein YgfZ
VAEAAESEYAAARAGAALVDLPDRGVLAVTGALRQKFLHGLLSNDVLGLLPGQGRRAALMDAKGHLLALMRVLVGQAEVWLEVAGNRADLVEDRLSFYRVATPVRFQRRPVEVLALVGPRAREVLARAGCEVPDLEPEAHAAGAVAGQPVLVSRAGDMPADGYVLHAESPAAAAAAAALEGSGAVPIGQETLDVLRIEDGRPWFGPDITEDNLLHETGLIGEYHSPTKGCYVGQEVIARLDARGGNVNKMMRGLRLSATAQAGSAVTSEGKQVGRVTTAGTSPRLGPVAMGYVHRSRFEPGTHVEVDGAAAAVVRLPFEVMERAVREPTP